MHFDDVKFSEGSICYQLMTKFHQLPIILLTASITRPVALFCLFLRNVFFVSAS